MRTMNALPKLSLIGTVVAASLLLAGCGEDGKATGPVILKTAFNQSEHNPQFKALEDFSQKLEAATGGKYKLEIHPNELLGDQRAALELVQSVEVFRLGQEQHSAPVPEAVQQAGSRLPAQGLHVPLQRLPAEPLCGPLG